MEEGMKDNTPIVQPSIGWMLMKGMVNSIQKGGPW